MSGFYIQKKTRNLYKYVERQALPNIRSTWGLLESPRSKRKWSINGLIENNLRKGTVREGMRPCLIHLLPVLIAAAVNADINGNALDENDSSFHKIPHPSGVLNYDSPAQQYKPTPKPRQSGYGHGHRRHRQQHPWMETNSQGPLEDRDIEATRTRYPDIEGRWLKSEVPPVSDKSRWHKHDTVDCYKSHQDGNQEASKPEDGNVEEGEYDEPDIPEVKSIRERIRDEDIGRGMPSVKEPQNEIYEKSNASDVEPRSIVGTGNNRGSNDHKIDSSRRTKSSHVSENDSRRNFNKPPKSHHGDGDRHRKQPSKFDQTSRSNKKEDYPEYREEKFAPPNRLKPFKEKKTVLVIGDEIVHFLRGEQLYGLCYVQTESYEGLTVADATDRLSQLMRNEAYPDRVVVHVGANDLVLESPNTPYIVAQRLKQLWNLFKDADYKIDSQIILSSVLPRPDEISNFNANVAVLDYKMRSFANREGMGYIDHYSGFMKDGRVKDELYRFDGTLNELGMRQFERVLFEDCNDGDEFGDKNRKKPSLELKDILPLDRKNYDKHVPPKKGGDPTTVYFHVTVLSVDSIDEESMTYVADIFLAQSWHDHRLRLPENMTEGYRILDVDWLKHIWRPDSFIKNAKKVTFHDMSVPNHYLWLYYDKTLLYMTKLTLEMSCAMKFEAYPHDNQICSMMIESLSHTTDDLVFLWNVTDPLVVYPDIELPQLDIADNSTEDCTLQYSTGNFTCLAVVFNLKRRVGYHLFHTYIPTTLIVVMSWISFWIRPEAIPARVTLGVTSLLTLATQNTQSQSSLPPVSYVKAIDVWMSSCTVFVFMSLMEFALVNHFLGNLATTKIMRGYSMDEGSNLNTSTQLIGTLPRNSNGDSLRSRARVNGGLRAVGLTRQDSMANVFQPRIVPSMDKPDLTVALAIDKFSRFFFPLSFCILNIVYWATYAKI